MTATTAAPTTAAPTTVSVLPQKVTIDFQWKGDSITAKIEPSLLRLKQGDACEVRWELDKKSVADDVKIGHVVNHWPFDDQGSAVHQASKSKPYVARTSKAVKDHYHYTVEGTCRKRGTSEFITVIVDPDIVVD